MVQGAPGRRIQPEGGAPGYPGKVQFRLGRPFADEGAEPVRREKEILDFEVHPGRFDVGKAGDGTVHMSADGTAQLPERESPDPEVRHRSLHLPGQGSLERETVQIRGEMIDSLHGNDRRGGEFPFQADAVQEVLVILVQGSQEAEGPEVDVGIPLLDVEVVQQHFAVADLHLSGKVPDIQAAFFADADMVRGPCDIPVFDQDPRGVDVGGRFQVVPVDHIRGDGAFSPGQILLRPGVVEHPEPEAFDVHFPGFEQVAEFFLGFTG